MNKFLKFSAALPLLVVAAGCTSDKDQEALNLPEELNVVVTISGNETRASRPLTDEVKNLQRENLNFATFDKNGNLKDYLFKGATNDANKSVSAFYFVPNWGPSVSAKLKRDQYKDDFFIGCFNIPKLLRQNSASNPFDIANLSTPSMTLMEWPGKQADHYIWNPDDVTDKTLMPMAGLTKVSREYMKKYNDNIYQYENTPFQLPDIELIPALAKIMIVDNAGLIESVDVKSPKYGSLFPDLNWWLNMDGIRKPAEPAGVAAQDVIQTLSSPTYVRADGKKVYVFYTFEKSFYRADGTLAPANDGARALITLHANDASGLKGTKRETTPVRFVPYSEGYPHTSVNLATEDGGAWQGVMRNTVYIFRVDAPPTGGVQVSVSAANWENHTAEDFSF